MREFTPILVLICLQSPPMLTLLIIAVIIAAPNYVLTVSKSNDNSNNTKDRNFYLTNSHNLTALNATGTLRDCSVTNMVGPCWDSPYESVRP
jgi:hypothetical protein